MIMRLGAQGLTLAEVLVASAIAVVVVIGIGQVDVTRLRINNQVRDISGISTPERIQAAFAVQQMTKQIERADRAVLDDSNAVYQFRIPEPTTDCPALSASCPVVCTGCTGSVPPPCCFDISKNYRWVQYRWDNLAFKFYDDTAAGCAPVVLAKEVGGFNVFFVDAEPRSPPGGEPRLLSQANTNLLGLGSDNNVIRVLLNWEDSAGHQEIFDGTVAMRALAYANLNVNCPVDSANAPCDSGTGLAPVGVSDPPAVCTN